METVLTAGPGGRILTHGNVWSADGEWIAFDTRSIADGRRFDGTTIRIVHTATGEVKTVYESKNGAHCGVVTWHPTERILAFIEGPEHPTPDWSYGPSRRQGVIVDVRTPGVAVNFDARDLVAPFTRGALRGGSHVHMWRRDGEAVSFTYEDEFLKDNLRMVAVAVPGEVRVKHRHERNHDGTHFSIVAATVTTTPTPGSDEIQRACEEGWLGRTNSLAFQGTVISKAGMPVVEVFVVDLPDHWKIAGASPLEGTMTQWPAPPKGTVQRRLTFTADRKYAGIQGPRHWLKSNPDGNRIAFLMKDDAGIVQLGTITPEGGELTLLTKCEFGVGSAFTWSPDGRFLTAIVDNNVSRIDADTGNITPLSPPSTVNDRIQPEAVVVSPCGKRVAYVRHRSGVNQICIAEIL